MHRQNTPTNPAQNSTPKLVGNTLTSKNYQPPKCARFEGDKFHVAHAKNLQEENEPIKGDFEFVRFSEQEGLAIYTKRK